MHVKNKLVSEDVVKLVLRTGLPLVCLRCAQSATLLLQTSETGDFLTAAARRPPLGPFYEALLVLRTFKTCSMEGGF